MPSSEAAWDKPAAKVAHPRAHLRSLRRLALHGLLFVLPIALVTVWFEIELGRLDTSYSIKRRQLEAGVGSFEVLVGGSSDALLGVDPSKFGVPAYNLANGSQSLHYDLGIVSNYFDQLARLRLVVIVHPPSYLQYELRNCAEAWRRHFYDRFWSVPEEVPARQLIAPHRWSYTLLYNPLTAIEYALDGFKVALAGGIEPNGFARPQTGASEVGLSAGWTRLRAEGHREQMKPESLRRNLATLAAFRERAREKGVTVAMVWAPVTADYRRFFGAEALAEQRALHDRLVREAGIAFFDYSSDARFGLGDFYDADHLNRDGAARLSEVLAREVVQPLLASPAPPR